MPPKEIGFADYLKERQITTANRRIFREYQLSSRDYRFKGMSLVEPNFSMYGCCLSCNLSEGQLKRLNVDLTDDHLFPKTLIRNQPQFIYEAFYDVVFNRKNLFLLCQDCHIEIDNAKIAALYNNQFSPTEMLDHIVKTYPFGNQNNLYLRILMANRAQSITEQYIEAIIQNQDLFGLTEFKPFKDSLPSARGLAGKLFKIRQQSYCELDEPFLNLIQSVA